MRNGFQTVKQNRLKKPAIWNKQKSGFGTIVGQTILTSPILKISATLTWPIPLPAKETIASMSMWISFTTK